MRILASADAEDDLVLIDAVLVCRQDPEKTPKRMQPRSS